MFSCRMSISAEHVPRELLVTATAWCGVPDIAADMARRCENPPQGQNRYCPNPLGRRPGSALMAEPCAPHSTAN